MSVTAEWHWFCELCDEHSEEPYGDQYLAADGERDHIREVHPEHLDGRTK